MGELGYNYLNTAFTGTSSESLSGHEELFPMVKSDIGNAAKIQEMEFKSLGDK